jgi:hypothetical protein
MTCSEIYKIISFEKPNWLKNIMCIKYNLIIVIGIMKQHGAQIKCTYIKSKTCIT